MNAGRRLLWMDLRVKQCGVNKKSSGEERGRRSGQRSPRKWIVATPGNFDDCFSRFFLIFIEDGCADSTHPMQEKRNGNPVIRYPELRLTDDMSLHIFELPKLEKKGKADQPEDDMVEWLYFFNHAHEEVEKTMRTHYKNTAIHEAFDVLEDISADEKNRHMAIVREKALKNEVSMLAAAERKGWREGEKKGKKKAALSLIRMGDLPMEKISAATGISLEELRGLSGREGM